jgi:hypothetical protein
MKLKSKQKQISNIFQSSCFYYTQENFNQVKNFDA